MKRLLLLFTLFLLIGCTGKEVIPSYIYINNVDVDGFLNPNESSNNIYFLSVYVGDEYLGNFPLPALIPTNQTGTKEVKMYAGIKDNGIISTLALYPFYEKLTFNHTFASGQIDTLSVSFKYREDAKLSFLESFELGNIFQNVISVNHPDGLIVDDENAKYGVYCGKIHLESSYPFLEVSSEDMYEDIPIDGSAVYLELDYKCETRLFVGVTENDQGVLTPHNALGINPKSEWNKIYVNLRDVINSTKLNSYGIFLGAILPVDENGNYSKDESNLFIDNVKLIHY